MDRGWVSARSSGAILREARLRAGWTQAELADASGKDRTQIARWERDVVAPSFETLLELVHACGFDIPLELVPSERAPVGVLNETVRLTPQQRLVRAHESYQDGTDPRRVVAALERSRVAYVVVGALARVIHGTDEPVVGTDLCPRVKEDNLERLIGVLRDLDASPEDDLSDLSVEALGSREVSRFATSAGAVAVVPWPVGTRNGWDDLRRHQVREALGDGVRAPTCSLEDCSRMLAALGRDADGTQLAQLRHLVELERSLGLSL